PEDGARRRRRDARPSRGPGHRTRPLPRLRGRPRRQRRAVRRARLRDRPAAAFLVLTLVLSVNFNLRRLYRPGEPMPPGGGVFRRLYQLVYAPQDRAIERFVDWRLRNATEAQRRGYHDRGSLVFLHNLGLATQHTAFAVCLAAGLPRLELLIVLACGLALLPLELRRGLRAAASGEPAPVRV